MVQLLDLLYNNNNKASAYYTVIINNTDIWLTKNLQTVSILNISTFCLKKLHPGTKWYNFGVSLHA